jgi:peptidoglycan/xylan/chitin deacetylase (PgdA/CDA1 family)
MEGSVFPICRSINSREKATVHDLQFLQHHGWSICNHTYSHKTLTKLSSSEVNYELSSSIAFLRSHGFTGQRFLAYPRGIYDRKLIDIVRNHCHLARSTRGGILKGDIGRYNVPSLGTDNYERYLKHIEYLSEGVVITLLLHSVGLNTGKATDTTVSDLSKICADLSNRRDKGELEILTIEQYFNLIVKGGHEAKYNHIK